MFPDGATGKILGIGPTRQVTKDELPPGDIVSDHLGGMGFAMEYVHGEVPPGTPAPGKNSKKPIFPIVSSSYALVSRDNRITVPVAVFRDTAVPDDTIPGVIFSDKDFQKNNDRLNNVARLFEIQESSTRQEDITDTSRSNRSMNRTVGEAFLPLTFSRCRMGRME